MYKIVNNLSDLNFNDYFFIENIPYSLRNNTRKIKTKKYYNCNTWSGSFFARASKYWNKLDKRITSAMSLNNFKNLLNTISFESLREDYSSVSLSWQCTLSYYIFLLLIFLLHIFLLLIFLLHIFLLVIFHLYLVLMYVVFLFHSPS